MELVQLEAAKRREWHHSIPKQFPSTIFPSLSTCTPRTPPHHSPTFTCPTSPPTDSRYKCAAVFGGHSDPDLASLESKHIDWHRCAVDAEELVQSSSDLDVSRKSIERARRLRMLVLLEANVRPGWIPEGESFGWLLWFRVGVGPLFGSLRCRWCVHVGGGRWFCW
jgi:hypothetical protein